MAKQKLKSDSDKSNFRITFFNNLQNFAKYLKLNLENKYKSL